MSSARDLADIVKFPGQREGLAEPGVEEFLALGVGTQKPSTLATYLITFGQARRIANAAGLTAPFKEMTPDQVKKLVVAFRRQANPKPLIRQVKTFMKYHERSEVLKFFPRVKTPATKVGPGDILSVEEVNRLLEAAKFLRDQVLIIALFESGGRVSEVLSLNLESLRRFENGKAWYRAWIGEGGEGDEEHEMKEGGTEHFVYFREAASVTILDEWIASYPAAIRARPRPLIPSVGNRAKKDQRLQRNSVKDLLKPLDKVVGKHLHAHLFRHTKASLLVREGVPEAMIKRLLGWKPNSAMLARYAHLKEDDIEAGLGLKPATEGQKVELRVPKTPVPVMPEDPFAAETNEAVARLQQEMESMRAEVAKVSAFTQGRLVAILAKDLDAALASGAKVVARVPGGEEIIVSLGGATPEGAYIGNPVIASGTREEMEARAAKLNAAIQKKEVR